VGYVQRVMAARGSCCFVTAGFRGTVTSDVGLKLMTGTSGCKGNLSRGLQPQLRCPFLVFLAAGSQFQGLEVCEEARAEITWF
jgi:hypothetical protein